MTLLHIDFETFSRCDLKKAGLANYAADPSTGVHCMAYAWDDGPVEVWRPSSGSTKWILTEDVLVYAHNAAFELAIWNNVMVPRYGWPVLRPEQCRCTMAMAYAMGLPGALKDAAPALGLEQRKDMAGARVMLQLAQPKRDGSMWRPEDDPAKFQLLYDYCVQDVQVERALHHRLLDLSPAEQALWALDYRINQNGVLVDLAAVDQALALVASEKTRLDGEMLRVTGGVVARCTEVKLLVEWIRSQGVTVPGLAKADVLDALDGQLPAAVRMALELRKEAAKSSTAKLVAMKDRASADGRVRGGFQYHGAATGRWAHRGIQTGNLPRPRPGTSPQDVEKIISHLTQPDYVNAFYGPVLDALADSLRGMIIAPPAKELLAVDFSAIEARVLAWLAGEEEVLDAFRAKEDIYKVAAGRIYRKTPATVTKDERQIGKVSVLALGYGGGIGAFQSMAKNYGLKLTDEEADQIKVAWRNVHGNIVSFWYGLERAAILALQNGAAHFQQTPTAPKIFFKKAGSFLWCKLPSGRVLCYPYPELREVETPWGDRKDSLTYMTVVSNLKAKIISDANASGQWKRISTYGGSLAENVTQAVARDLLADAMLRFAERGEKICAHVHDEIVCEVHPDADVKQFEALMSQAPAWAVGLPLAAEGWKGPRYRK